MCDVAVFEQDLLKTTAKTRAKWRTEGKDNVVEVFKSCRSSGKSQYKSGQILHPGSHGNRLIEFCNIFAPCLLSLQFH